MDLMFLRLKIGYINEENICDWILFFLSTWKSPPTFIEILKKD